MGGGRGGVSYRGNVGNGTDFVLEKGGVTGGRGRSKNRGGHGMGTRRFGTKRRKEEGMHYRSRGERGKSRHKKMMMMEL